MSRPETIGVVVIGRNEGERLRACLRSVLAPGRVVVYVDSGSSDGSVEVARTLGADVVALDLQIPFTAARARNAGLRRLGELAPATAYVQFVDGDCEMNANWLAAAVNHLDESPRVVAVCGRRRERFPAASIYNRLCDLEWDTPIGLAEACGGDALFRVAALKKVGGFRETMIAGEEPELCVRLRAAGGLIERLDHEMTLHDAAMARWSQWWTRAVRAGHAYSEGTSVTRHDPKGLWRREVRSTWFWGLFVPLLAIVPVWWTHGWSLLVLLAYPLLGVKIAVRTARRWSLHHALMYGAFGVLAKFAHLQGMLRYYRNGLTGRRSRLIEYKAPAVSVAP